VLNLTPEHKLEFDFVQGSDDGSQDEAVDFSGQTPLGPCPKCAGRVFEQPMNYICENATGPAKTCDFRSGKVILQQPIERAQMEKLLKDGRTDVMRGFVSNRTRRKFAAFLVRKPDGSVGFEFEPRPQGGRKTAGKTAVRADGAGAAEATPAAAKAPAKTATAAKAAKAVKTAKSAKSVAKATKSVTKAAAKTATRTAAKGAAKSATKTARR